MVFRLNSAVLSRIQSKLCACFMRPLWNTAEATMAHLDPVRTMGRSITAALSAIWTGTRLKLRSGTKTPDKREKRIEMSGPDRGQPRGYQDGIPVDLLKIVIRFCDTQGCRAPVIQIGLKSPDWERWLAIISIKIRCGWGWAS